MGGEKKTPYNIQKQRSEDAEGLLRDSYREEKEQERSLFRIHKKKGGGKKNARKKHDLEPTKTPLKEPEAVNRNPE